MQYSTVLVAVDGATVEKGSYLQSTARLDHDALPSVPPRPVDLLDSLDRGRGRGRGR